MLSRPTLDVDGFGSFEEEGERPVKIEGGSKDVKVKDDDPAVYDCRWDVRALVNIKMRAHVYDTLYLPYHSNLLLLLLGIHKHGPRAPCIDLLYPPLHEH